MPLRFVCVYQRRLMIGLINAALGAAAEGLNRKALFRWTDWPGRRNARAPVCGDGLLYFDISWLEAEILPRFGSGAVIAIVYHEAAHAMDCRPSVCGDWELELYADYVAGWLLAFHGTPIGGIGAYLQTEAKQSAGWSEHSTHPPALLRLRAYHLGYNDGLTQHLPTKARHKSLRKCSAAVSLTRPHL